VSIIVLAGVGKGHRVFDDDGPAGRALPLAGHMPSAGDGGGGVTGSNGDRLPAGSTGCDRDDGTADVVGVRFRAGRAGMCSLVDVDLIM
jgi:hypothetical protein